MHRRASELLDRAVAAAAQGDPEAPRRLGATQLALGAHAAGFARPALKALHRGGVAAVHEFFDEVEAELRAVMLLVGAGDLASLRHAPRILSGELRGWLDQLGLDHARG